MAWTEYLHNYMREQDRADLWRVFGDRFMQLAREEQGRANVVTKGRVLQAMNVLRIHGDYHTHPEVWLNRENPEQHNFCLLNTPPHGAWGLYDGVLSENFLERVRVCVSDAGRFLPDYPKGADSEDFWLHTLYFDLLKNRSDLLFCASEQGGMIMSVCIASATFCSRLQRQALEPREPNGSTVAESMRTGREQAGSPRAENCGETAEVMESKPTGRPRKDAERELVRTLKNAGDTWKDIAAKVNAQTRQNKSPDAYRGLLKRRSGAGEKGQK